MSTIAKSGAADAIFAARQTPASRWALAAKDVADGLSKSWIWTVLALQDIRIRYRGSILGPFWLTVSTLIMVAAMGVIYAHLLNSNLAFYIPYLTTGLVFWQFVANTITESCQTFVLARSVIQQVPLPFSLHAYRVVCRNLIVLAHNLILVPLVLLLFHVPVDWHVLLFPLALLLVSLNGVWIALLFGMVSARFLDIPPIVASFLQLIFFVTPIFWPVQALGRWQGVAELNPLFASVDLMRSPLLGVPTAPYSWWIVAATLILGSAGTFALFARFRARIAYWL